MLVWVASFPRSGNTFLRIVLNRRYGVRTSVIYDHDGVAERVGSELVGYVDRPGPLAALRGDEEPHFVKTHRPRGSAAAKADEADVSEADAAICLVRDGRDALVSWARLLTADSPEQFTAVLRQRIENSDGRGSGSWGENVLSWLLPPVPHRVLLSYAELIADPVAAADRVAAVVAPGLRPGREASIPSFGELHRVDAGFFRRGVNGSHAEELPAELHELFWSRPENRTAMDLLKASRTA